MKFASQQTMTTVCAQRSSEFFYRGKAENLGEEIQQFLGRPRGRLELGQLTPVTKVMVPVDIDPTE